MIIYSMLTVFNIFTFKIYNFYNYAYCILIITFNTVYLNNFINCNNYYNKFLDILQLMVDGNFNFYFLFFLFLSCYNSYIIMKTYKYFSAILIFLIYESITIYTNNIYQFISYIQPNFKLLNGLFWIHPFILLYIYSLFFLIINCFKLFVFVKYTNNNTLIFTLYKYIYHLLGLFCFIGVILGSWWAFQELTWIVWWSWDPIEIINIIIYIYILYIIHIFFNKLNFIFYFISIYFISLLLTLFFIIVRFNLINSLHSFINTNDWYFLFLFIFICSILIFYSFYKYYVYMYKSFLIFRKSKKLFYLFKYLYKLLIYLIVIYYLLFNNVKVDIIYNFSIYLLYYVIFYYCTFITPIIFCMLSFLEILISCIFFSFPFFYKKYYYYYHIYIYLFIICIICDLESWINLLLISCTYYTILFNFNINFYLSLAHLKVICLTYFNIISLYYYYIIYFTYNYIGQFTFNNFISNLFKINTLSLQYNFDLIEVSSNFLVFVNNFIFYIFFILLLYTYIIFIL